MGPVGPTFDPVTAVVFALSAAHARFVAVSGNPLMIDGRLVAPGAGLRDRVGASADALNAWLSAGGEVQAPPAAGIK
jgi:hypothetical protein